MLEALSHYESSIGQQVLKSLPPIKHEHDGYILKYDLLKWVFVSSTDNSYTTKYHVYPPSVVLSILRNHLREWLHSDDVEVQKIHGKWIIVADIDDALSNSFSWVSKKVLFSSNDWYCTPNDSSFMMFHTEDEALIMACKKVLQESDKWQDVEEWQDIDEWQDMKIFPRHIIDMYEDKNAQILMEKMGPVKIQLPNFKDPVFLELVTEDGNKKWVCSTRAKSGSPLPMSRQEAYTHIREFRRRWLANRCNDITFSFNGQQCHISSTHLKYEISANSYDEGLFYFCQRCCNMI